MRSGPLTARTIPGSSGERGKATGNLRKWPENNLTRQRENIAARYTTGESGPEAGDGSAAQTCSSVPTPPAPASVQAGFSFSKTKYRDQLPSLSSESKCQASHG